MFLNLEIHKLNLKEWDFILKVFHNLRKKGLLNLLQIGEKPAPVCFDLANNVSTEKLVSIN